MPSIQFVKFRKQWYVFSLALVAGCVLFLGIHGLKLGLDFTGGSLLELEYSIERPTIQNITAALSDAGIESPRIQQSGETVFIIRTSELSEERHQALLAILRSDAASLHTDNEITEHRFESIGPTIGKELRERSLYAIVFVLIAIIAYLAYAFRRVSRPISSWKFGVIAIIALIHDALIVIGIYSAFGYFFGTEIDTLFLTALLTLLGFSVHDTIVTMDRVRENLLVRQELTFEELVNVSINETIVRSINTSLTTIITLAAIFFFGGNTIKDFSLALIIGIIVGTYSSIFVAAPLLVTWYKYSLKRT